MTALFERVKIVHALARAIGSSHITLVKQREMLQPSIRKIIQALTRII
jgi:hypothetical protein